MSDVDDFTELVDFDPDQVDLVGKAANGTQILVAKGADGEPAGLFDSGFVRELVAKADADAAQQGAPGAVTLTGAPAAVADMIARVHAASVRKTEMSSADINDLPDSAFAYIEPGGEKDAEGKTTPRSKRHFPVHDEAHARNALSRAPQSPFGEKAMPKIKAAARKFGIEVAKALDPGSSDWESQDATTAETVTAMILACIPHVRALAMREAAEVGAGHVDDICDVIDLQCAIDSLTCAAKSVGAFAVSEHAEAGDAVSKAQPPASNTAAPAAPSPKEKTVETTTEVTKAEEAAAAGTEQAQPVSKAAVLAEQLGISPEKLAEIGAQAVLKAAADAAAATQTSGAAPAPAEDARVIPGTGTVQSPVQASDEVMKAMAGSFATALTEAVAPLAKQVGDLAGQVSAQGERVEKMAAQPDNRRSPLLNGATGEPHLAQRGPASSPEFQAVLKGVAEMPEGPMKEEAQRVVGLAAIKARFSSGS